MPLVGSVFALATGGADRMSRIGLVGLLIGLAGVIGIVGSDFATTDPTALVQIALVVVCYAVGPAILARRLDGLPTVGVMAVSLALCALVYIPIAAVQLPAAVPSPTVLIAVVVLAVVCTAAAFLVFAALIDEIGPVRATVITYVNPAVAAVLGVVILHETLHPRDVGRVRPRDRRLHAGDPSSACRHRADPGAGLSSAGDRDRGPLLGMRSRSLGQAGTPSNASRSCSTLIFVISSIAFIARAAAARSSLWIIASSWRGTTCQDTPKRSFSQPHTVCDPPPATSASQ